MHVTIISKFLYNNYYNYIQIIHVQCIIMIYINYPEHYSRARVLLTRNNYYSIVKINSIIEN